MQRAVWGYYEHTCIQGKREDLAALSVSIFTLWTRADRDLFQKLLLRLLNDGCVGVTHHSDQHVQQKDRDQDLEKNKDDLRHVWIRTLSQQIILKM